MGDMYLLHSAKGSEWKDHKYKNKHVSKNGKTVYEYYDEILDTEYKYENAKEAYNDAPDGSVQDKVSKFAKNAYKKRGDKLVEDFYKEYPNLKTSSDFTDRQIAEIAVAAGKNWVQTFLKTGKKNEVAAQTFRCATEELRNRRK